MAFLDLVRILFLFNAEKCLTQLKWQIRIRNWPLTKGASAMLLYAALLFNFTDMKKNYFPLVVCHSLLSSLSMTSSSQSWQFGAIYQKAQRQNSCEIIFLMCKQPQCACLSFSHAHTPLLSERFKICWELGTHLGWMQLLNKTTLTLSDKPFLATPQFNSANW